MSGLPIALPTASSNEQDRPRSDGADRRSKAGTVRVSPGASRLGSRRLATVARGLSDRDLAVLQRVGQLRLATSSHLEPLHFADAATPLTAARKSRRTLQRLVKLGLLLRLERRIGGLHAGSAGYVYALTGAGQKLLDLPGRRRRNDEPTLPFVEHTLAIADLFTALHIVAGSRSADPDSPVVTLLDVQTEPDCWRSWTALDGRQLLRPDLYAAVAIGSEEVRWFVEVDRATEHRPALVRKANVYQAYYESGKEQDREGIYPGVAWVVPTEQRAEQLLAALANAPGLEPQLFTVLLMADAASQLLT